MGLATYAGQVALEGLASDDAARVVDGLAQALDSAHCYSAVTGQRTVAWSGDLFFRSGSGLNRQLYGGVLDIVESQPLSVRYSAKAGWLGDTLRFGVPYAFTGLVIWLISRDIVWSVSVAVLFTVFSVIAIQRQRRERLPLTIRRMALDWRDREYQACVSGKRLQA